jgi:hypothetical protein
VAGWHSFRSAAIHHFAQGLHFIAQIVNDFCTAFGSIAHTLLRIANAIPGLIAPVLNPVAGIFVAPLQISAELLPGFWGKNQPEQGAGAKSDQKKRNSGSKGASGRRFIISRTHTFTSFLRMSAGKYRAEAS